jgi:hypothetical protein
VPAAGLDGRQRLIGTGALRMSCSSHSLGDSRADVGHAQVCQAPQLCFNAAQAWLYGVSRAQIESLPPLASSRFFPLGGYGTRPAGPG